jgi:glycerol kinase
VLYFDLSTNGLSLWLERRSRAKSAVKAVAQSLCFELDDPLVVITKVSESHDFTRKLTVCGRLSSENYIVSASSLKNGGRVNWNIKRGDSGRAERRHGTCFT